MIFKHVFVEIMDLFVLFVTKCGSKSFSAFTQIRARTRRPLQATQCCPTESQ